MQVTQEGSHKNEPGPLLRRVIFEGWKNDLKETNGDLTLEMLRLSNFDF